MKHELFSVYDSKAETYGPIFTSKNKAMAIRLIQQSAPGTTMGTYPSDFILFQLGSFDDDTAEFDHPGLINLGHIDTFLQPSDKE